MTTETKPELITEPSDAPFVIRVLRQVGPGYWAKIYLNGRCVMPVQSPAIYGFDTPKQAREAARKRLPELRPCPK